jgi:hypothetical protein
MENPQLSTQPGGALLHKRDWTLLVAIIGAIATVAAALIARVTRPAAAATTPRTYASGHPDQPAAPTLTFVPESLGTVPWWDTFFITASGQLPADYEILIFDASADTQFQVTSYYGYDKQATRAPGVADEWKTGPVYAGPSRT